MTSIRIAPLIAALALVFVLAACGSTPPQSPGNDTPPPVDDTPPPGDDTPPPGDDDPGTGAGITKIGMIDLEATDLGFGSPLVSGSGAFFQTNVAVPLDGLQRPYDDVVGTCEVSSAPSEPGDVDDIPSLPGDFSITFLDGGDVLTVNQNGTLFATLERETVTVGDDTIIVYDIADDIEGALPDGLTLTVPGGQQFPAFTNEAFPTVGTFALTTPAIGATIDADTVFTWEPSGTSHAFVTIMVVDSDLATFVTCFASDADGSLAFSPAVKAELGDEFAGSLQLVELTAVRVATNAPEGAALVLTATSSTVSLFAGFPEIPGFELPDLP